METFVIRRHQGRKTPQELEQAAQRSARIDNEEMPDRVRWIHTYVVTEPDGQLGTVCIYQATNPAALREHAAKAGMPADEISPVINTVCVRLGPAYLELFPMNRPSSHL